MADLRPATTDDDEVVDEELETAVDDGLAPVTVDSFQAQAGFLHSISAECNSTLKLFNLRDTGAGMLERTLVHPGHKLQDAVYRGFTCRAARWDPGLQFYAFNGRSGEPIEVLETDDSAALPECTFTPLRGDVRAAGDDETPDQGVGVPRARQWEFAGFTPTMNQFLDGMGKIDELVDPETARDPSELPSDARKYNEAPEHQVISVAKLRRPAPVEQNSDEDEQSSSDDDSSSYTDRDAGEKAGHHILNKLGQHAVQTPQYSINVAPTANADESDASATTPKANMTSFGGSIGTTIPQTGHCTGSANTVPLSDYDRSYAKVDKNGLTGHAVLQAQWEHSNPVSSPKKLNKHGVSKRAQTQIRDLPSQPTSSSSTAMSLSTGPDVPNRQDVSPASSFSMLPPIAPLESSGYNAEFMPDTRWASKPKPWAHNQHHSTSVTANIVDVSVPQSRTSTNLMHPPPGLDLSSSKLYGPPTGSSLRDRQVDENGSVPLQPSASAQPSSGETMDRGSNKLVDLEWDEPIPTVSNAELMWNALALQPTVKSPDRKPHRQLAVGNRPIALLAEDAIVERLQDQTNQDRPLRNTMRQKAGKTKKKGKSNAGTPKPKAQLPKLTTPPPSKASKAIASTSKEAGSDGDPPRQQDFGDPSGVNLEESHIEKLLRQVESLHGRQDVKLEVAFGTLVVRPQDSDMCRENWSAAKLEERLQQEETKGDLRTDFFERLTTSATDARFMFDLLPFEKLPPHVEYEMTVRLLQGETRTIKFDQHDPASFAIFCPEQVAVALFMHYPIRVHDARSRVIKHELALDVDSEKVATFVSSISSLDDAPSFIAFVPTQAFNVEQVHVKSVFAKQVVPGVQLKVEEVQDLRLDPVANDRNYNFKATSAGRENMVDNHRLWYGCSLHLTPLGGVQGGVLQRLVDQMVAAIDGVGFHNKGPYVKTEIEEEPEVQVKFW